MINPISFEVQVRAKDKKQFKKLIKELVRLEYEFTFSTMHGDPYNGPYILDIKSSWGNNLEWIGKMLSKEDGSHEWDD